MPEPIVIRASVNHIECPHCSYELMGFLNDPRGGTFKCDECGKEFDVPDDAVVDLD